MSEVTQILWKIESGDQKVSEELLPLVYDELRKLAAARMVTERPDHTLSATALVHEAYVRLVDAETVKKWDSRGHFFAAAGEAMRRILVDKAREKCGQKRGGGWERIDLKDVDPADVSTPELVLAVSDALEQIASEDPRLADLVKLRYFGGFTVDEAAEALGISRAAAVLDWRYVKSRLLSMLNPTP